MLKKRMVHLGWALFSLVLAWIFFVSYIHAPSVTTILLTIFMLGFAVLNLKLGFWKKSSKGGKKPAAKAPPPKAPAAKK